MNKKKTLLLISVLAIGAGWMANKLIAAAGNQYNWGAQNGQAWQTPDDSKTTVGQILQIGSSGGSNIVAGGAPVSLYSGTTTQLASLVPATTGQIMYCTNCTNTVIVVSTGIGTGAWCGVFNSTYSIVPIKFQ